MTKLVSSLVGGVGSTLFGGATKTPDAPAQPAPAPMAPLPDSNDPAVRMQKRKKAAEIQARSGRASTLLSDMGTSDKLGG